MLVCFTFAVLVALFSIALPRLEKGSIGTQVQDRRSRWSRHGLNFALVLAGIGFLLGSNSGESSVGNLGAYRGLSGSTWMALICFLSAGVGYVNRLLGEFPESWN